VGDPRRRKEGAVKEEGAGDWRRGDMRASETACGRKQSAVSIRVRKFLLSTEYLL